MAGAAAAIKLDAALGLSAATPLHAALAAARGGAVEIEGADVEKIGGQCLQVLLAAQAAWIKDGASFRLINPSDALREGLAAMGAASLLQEGEGA